MEMASGKGDAFSSRLFHSLSPFAFSIRRFHSPFPFAVSIRRFHSTFPFAVSIRRFHSPFPFAVSIRRLRSPFPLAVSTRHSLRYSHPHRVEHRVHVDRGARDPCRQGRAQKLRRQAIGRRREPLGER